VSANPPCTRQYGRRIYIYIERERESCAKHTARQQGPVPSEVCFSQWFPNPSIRRMPTAHPHLYQLARDDSVFIQKSEVTTSHRDDMTPAPKVVNGDLRRSSHAIVEENQDSPAGSANQKEGSLSSDGLLRASVLSVTSQEDKLAGSHSDARHVRNRSLNARAWNSTCKPTTASIRSS
jgi:hypothetical protein